MPSDRLAARSGLPAGKIHRDLERYLSQTLNPDDYPNLLAEYFRAIGRQPPRSFDPQRPADFIGTRSYSQIRDSFACWVVMNVMLDKETESSPSYLSLHQPVRLPQGTWMIHFSDNADEISREGFLFGHPRYRGLAYTCFKEDGRFSEPGFNYAFRAEDKFIDYPQWSEGFGGLAVMFRSSGVRAYHSGDGAHEVIFWGPSVRRFVLLRKCFVGSGPERIYWCVRSNTTNRVLFMDEKVSRVAKWVAESPPSTRRLLVRTVPTERGLP